VTVERWLAVALVVLGAALTACGQGADKTIRAGDSDRYRPSRYRFEEDGVTCYAIAYGISCVRDERR